jgi:hypothetical protein
VQLQENCRNPPNVGTRCETPERPLADPLRSTYPFILERLLSNDLTRYFYFMLEIERDACGQGLKKEKWKHVVESGGIHGLGEVMTFEYTGAIWGPGR